MSLLDLIRSIPERMGRGQERNIGGLLGIDPEDMTEQERRQARRLSQMAVFDAMARGTTPMAGLSQAAQLIGGQREERAKKREAEQRQQAAQQASSQIAGRLLGGAPAPTAPGAMGGDGLTGVDVQAQYRQDPMDALRLAMSPAGADAMQINPLLQAPLQEMLKPQAGPEYVYQNVPGIGLVAVNRSDPSDSKIVQRIQEPKAAEKQQFNLLSAEDAVQAGFAPGTVVQRNPSTGQLSVLQRPMALPDSRGFNDRQRSGASVLKDAAMNYAANLTGLPKAQLLTMTPAQVEAAMVEQGKRVTQGGVARTIRGIPLIGEGILATINSDLMAASSAGGSGIAMIQNPTGPITTPDVEIGKLQFPSPIYPVEVQAQMLRSLLEQVDPTQAGNVEQYDSQGNRRPR